MRNRRFTVRKRIFYFVVALLTVFYIRDSFRDFFGDLGNCESKNISIPEGYGINQISDLLTQERIIRHKQIFRIVAKSHRSIFIKGRYELSKGMGYREIISKLTDKHRGPERVRVLIPEGYELRNIVDKLEECGLINRIKFMSEVEFGNFDYSFLDGLSRPNRLEGYLFPATYDIVKGTSEYEIIDSMLKKFSDIVLPIYADRTDRTLDEIVIMASIIEREAKSEKDSPLVSGVFYNRLANNMKLESCATIQYILKSRVPVVSYSQTHIDSKYNTYLYKGLPIGPISSPGERAIIAAVNPENTNYMFFRNSADRDELVFSKTFQEHQAWGGN